jgi:eukaryotic-like serine/threonine-protein kinase
MTTDRRLGMAPSMAEGKSPMGGAGVAPEGQGRLVGRRYRLLSPVGRGGMGMVWHAHDVLLDRDVAVKELILPFGLDHAGKQVAHRRMLREARSAARLSHPGIVTVHDVVEEDGRPWIVMELVRAWSLEQAVRQSGPLPVVQAAEIGVRVLDALRHAHAAGILHRDVKPGNVLLTADRVVLTDFGIAAIEGDVTITQTGLLMGSPAYIPPERLQGRPITHAADLWSYGATLYAAVEGRPPYEGPDAVAVLGAVLTQEPNRPQRAGALLPVIEGLLRKNPADRMPAAQAADLLERVLRTHGSGLSLRGADRYTMTPLPTRADSTPVHMLPPLDPPSGPMPSRIIETPSGPVRIPFDPNAADADGGHSYDALRSPSGPQPGSPYDALRSTSAPQPGNQYDAFRSNSAPQPGNQYDALRSTSAPQPNPYDSLRSPSGPQPDPYDALRSPSGPNDPPGARPDPYDALRSTSGPQPFDPLSGGSATASPGDARAAGATGSRVWPKPSPNLADKLARDLDGDPFARPEARGVSREGRQDGPGARARRRRPEVDDAREGRSPVMMILAGIGVVGVVAALLFVLWPAGSPPQDPVAGPLLATGGATSSAPQPSTEAGTSGDPAVPTQIPASFRTRTAAGASVAVPKDWTVSASSEAVTYLGPKNSGRRIQIKKVPSTGDDGLTALTKAKDEATLTDYAQARLESSTFGNGKWQASVWEYTYTALNNVTTHAITRHITIDSHTAYEVTFTTPDAEWDHPDNRQTMAVLWSSFKPAS